MVDVKVSALPVAAKLDNADILPVVRAGISVQASAAQVARVTVSGLAKLNILQARLALRDLAPCLILQTGSSTAANQGVTNEARAILARFILSLQRNYPLQAGATPPIYGVALADHMTFATNGVQSVKAAISGASSADYWSAQRVAWAGALNPAAFLHMIGSNDYSVNVVPATFKANVAGWLDQLDAVCALPHVHVLIHGHRRMNNTSPVYAWQQYGQQLKDLAEARSNVVFVDLSMAYSAMAADAGDPLGFVGPDRIHMNDQGHTFGADLLTGYLTPTSIQSIPFVLGTDAAQTTQPVANLVLPRISGTAQTGQTVTASTGTWLQAPDSYTYAWLRNGAAISGATAATYTLASADEGQAITVAVTGVKANYTSTTATSEVTTAAAAGQQALSNTVAPAISGTAQSGQTVTGSNGTWSATPDSYTYAWKRAGTAVAGATAQTYVLVAGDVGQAITVTVTAVKSGYTSGTATSAAITPTAAGSGYSETFPGADGAAWPAQWKTSSTSSSAGTITQVGGKGRMLTGAGSYVYTRAWMTGAADQSDTDMTTDFTLGTLAAIQGVYFGISCGDTAYQQPDNGYLLYLSINVSGVVTARIRKRLAAATTDSSIVTLAAFTDGATYKARVQKTGTTIQAKVWLATAAEPASWSVSYTDTGTLATAGRVHLGYTNADTGAKQIDFDNLTVV